MESETLPSRSWALKFTDAAAFGNFCALLGQNRKIGFGLVGFQTLVFRERPEEAMKRDPEAEKVYLELKTSGVLEEYSAEPQGRKRYLPTIDETQDLLRGFIRRRKEHMAGRYRKGA